MLFGSFRNANSRGTRRALAEGDPGDSCYGRPYFLGVPRDPVDKRALQAAQGLLAALELPPAAVQDLKATERDQIRDAKVILRGKTERLKSIALITSRSPTTQSQEALAERDGLRTLLASFEWSAAHDVEALRCRATAFSLGRRIPHTVACALVAAEQVNRPDKPLSTTLTQEQQKLVENMVRSMQEEAERAAYTLKRAEDPAPPVVEAATEVLKESERLTAQLHIAGMSGLSESLKSSSFGLRGVLTRIWGWTPKRTVSLPSVLRKPHHGQPGQDSQVAKGAQALRNSFRSALKPPREAEGGAEGSSSFTHRFGTLLKATRAFNVLQRLTSSPAPESESDSTDQPPTSPDERMPERAEVPPQERKIDAEEASSLTAAMETWTATCKEVMETLNSGAANDSAFDDVAAEGSSLELTTSRYDLQASVSALNTDNPPRAKGPYIGHLDQIKTTAAAAKEASGRLSRFLGVDSTHHRLSDAVGGLATVVRKAEDELQGAVDAAARTWIRALEEAEERRLAGRTVRIFLGASGARPSISLDSSLFEHAEEAIQALKSFGWESAEVQLLDKYLNEQRRAGTAGRRSEHIQLGYRVLPTRTSLADVGDVALSSGSG
ncbi:hypothetical protein, conserved [Eimeria brunetti]|uniref:Uncharacterized protein n=1 Tax=Eimeria brunetti TaxID=51314 RepID=U6LVT5_9EIME|nr:hypothetical protein, conserved [Eimeria brunetti]